VLAAQCYDELLGDRAPRGDAALPLLAAAAWQAHRAGAGERQAALLSRLDAELAAAVPARTADPAFGAATASAALLHLELGSGLPAFAPALLAAIHPEQQPALERRLADRGVDTAALTGAAAAVGSQRLFLGEIARLCARGLRPGAQAADAGRLLLYFPDRDGETGAGALVDGQTMLRALGQPAPGEPLADASASSVLGSVAPDGAEEVVAGL
jgi:hypothetical protein